MYYRLYNALFISLFGIVSPVFCLYALLTGRHLRRLPERFGFVEISTRTVPGQLRIWLHAASVGEVQAAKALLPALQDQFPGAAFLMSTMTGQGLTVADKQLGNKIECFLAPLDLPFTARRTVQRVRPDIYICIETELWPNLLRLLKKNGTVLVLLNGRLSERSFRRYMRVKSFMRQVLSCFSRISAIQPSDAEKLATLGGDRNIIKVNGNAKYDLPLAAKGKTERDYRLRLGLGEEQQVLIAGSTRSGEERLLLVAYKLLKQKWPNLVLIIAPRHLERVQEIRTLLATSGNQFDLLSELAGRERQHPLVLVDTMGELANLYSVGTYIFCGGSLVECGGHNIMEAAAWGKPVFFGPHMKDFADAKELLESAGAGFEVDSPESLSAAIFALAENPEDYARAALQAETTVRRQRGSAHRQAELAAEGYKSSIR